MFNVSASSNLILWETERAYLLRLPKTKYKFWISKKLARTSADYGYKINMIIPSDFEVRIFKNGEGKYNKKEVIDERVISIEEFLKQFGLDLNNDILEDLIDYD